MQNGINGVCPVCGGRRANSAPLNCACAACGFEAAYVEYFAGEESRKLWEQRVEAAKRRRLAEKAARFWKDARFVLESGSVSLMAAKGAELVTLYGNETMETEKNVLQYDAAERNSAILYMNGTVKVRGDNSYGQCGTKGLSGIAYVMSAPNCTYAVDKNGFVHAAGAAVARDVHRWENVKSMACGTYHILALRNDGRVYIGGEMLDREVSAKVAGWTDVKAVSAATDCSVALFGDGTVSFAGRKNDPRAACEEWTGIASIQADSSYVVGLTKDGEVRLAGSCKPILDMGRSSAREWKDVAAISCGRSGIGAVAVDGSLLVKGNFVGNLEWVKGAWKKKYEEYMGSIG